LSDGALLCGECGTSAIAPRPTLGDTARFDRRQLLDAIAREQGSGAPEGPSAPSASRSTPAVGEAVPPSAPIAEEPAEVLWLPPAIPPAAAGLVSDAPADPGTPPAVGLVGDVPHPAVTSDAPAAPAEPAAPSEPAVFSLVFSTGESVRIAGHGLVGRNPTPGDGESVDYVVQIVDPQRSVSKTHLEFGVDGESLWVSDRNSSNGTRISDGALDTVELRPGRRTRVPRGARVEIGDQYFDVH
jgi:hypothetical protein